MRGQRAEDSAHPQGVLATARSFRHLSLSPRRWNKMWWRPLAPLGIRNARNSNRHAVPGVRTRYCRDDLSKPKVLGERSRCPALPSVLGPENESGGRRPPGRTGVSHGDTRSIGGARKRQHRAGDRKRSRGPRCPTVICAHDRRVRARLLLCGPQQSDAYCQWPSTQMESSGYWASRSFIH